eukprot:7502202-Pyramimonas_sp.AAC.1
MPIVARSRISLFVEPELMQSTILAFWIRGLTPSSWTAVPPPPEVADFRRLGGDLGEVVVH